MSGEILTLIRGRPQPHPTPLMSTVLAFSFTRFRPLFRGAVSLLALAIVACGLTPLIHAHGDLHGQIQMVSQEIAHAPSATLHLKRGGLYHDHEDYAQALADYDLAARMDPTLEGVWLARGRTCFKSGRLVQAREALDIFLKKKADHADGFLLRARVLSALKHHPEAVKDFDRNLALTGQPLPECFLERAEALNAAGEKSAALKSLDEGLQRMGNLVTLQGAAIALELALGRHDAALGRVDRVLTDLQRKESWLTRRAEILEAAGRHAEARVDFAAALSAIDRLPAHHRDAKSMRDLQARVRLKLGSAPFTQRPVSNPDIVQTR